LHFLVNLLGLHYIRSHNDNSNNILRVNVMYIISKLWIKLSALNGCAVKSKVFSIKLEAVI